MKNNIEEFGANIFEKIKHYNEEGREYWLARELMVSLGYSKWENFYKAIERSLIAYRTCVDDDFWLPEIRKPIKTGKGRIQEVTDYKLPRIICYLIAQNSDPRKVEVAQAQSYFATKTRKQEIFEMEHKKLSEDKKRLYRRKQTKEGNKTLYKVARSKGVENFDKFTNAGYKGLYNGETADDIAKRKGIRYNDDILNNMNSEELGANIFRITQTEALLKKQKEKSETEATNTHYIVGKTIREAIQKLGGTMPEELPTPEKSLKYMDNKIDNEEKSLIENK